MRQRCPSPPPCCAGSRSAPSRSRVIRRRGPGGDVGDELVRWSCAQRGRRRRRRRGCAPGARQVERRYPPPAARPPEQRSGLRASSAGGETAATTTSCHAPRAAAPRRAWPWSCRSPARSQCRCGRLPILWVSAWRRRADCRDRAARDRRRRRCRVARSRARRRRAVPRPPGPRCGTQRGPPAQRPGAHR